MRIPEAPLIELDDKADTTDVYVFAPYTPDGTNDATGVGSTFGTQPDLLIEAASPDQLSAPRDDIFEFKFFDLLSGPNDQLDSGPTTGGDIGGTSFYGDDKLDIGLSGFGGHDRLDEDDLGDTKSESNPYEGLPAGVGAVTPDNPFGEVDIGDLLPGHEDGDCIL